MKKLQWDGSMLKVPEVVALRRTEPVCTDNECGLSACEAHVGACEPCDCGLGHARKECAVAHAAGWKP